PHLSAQVSKVRKLSLQQVLESIGYDSAAIPDLVREAFDCFLEHRNAIRLFPQTIPLLADLQKNYALASVTNGNSDLEKIGIANYFQFALSAEKVGASKPRPNLFHAVLHRANARAHETIHIGDHPVDDIQGAQQLGIHTIWFNPGQQPWNDPST